MRQVILASSSPRRKDLLEQMGVKFTAIPSDFDEQLDDSRSTEEVAMELGLGKAMTVARKHPKALVIGSDTIVTLNGQQLGKPLDRADAKRLLEAHTGQTVTITTSLVVICLEIGFEEVLTDTSIATFKGHDSKLIEAYLETGDWHDKAGGWGLQSGAAPLVELIIGECDTVMGLPTAELARILNAHGIKAHAVSVPCPVPQQKQPARR